MNDYTEDARNLMVDALPATVWISLHDADPGETGANEVAGVARQSTTLQAATGGVRIADPDQLTFDLTAGDTVAFVGLWDSQTGGVFLAGTAVDQVIFDADNSYRVTNISVDLNLDCSGA